MTLMGMPRAPTIKTAVSEVVTCTDVYLTDGGVVGLFGGSNHSENSGDSKRAIRAALDGHKSMKQVIVVDTDIDVTNSTRVEWALMTRWQPDKDTLILSDQKDLAWIRAVLQMALLARLVLTRRLIPVPINPFESVL